jgi:hypothetical protein
MGAGRERAFEGEWPESQDASLKFILLFDLGRDVMALMHNVSP